MLLTHNYLTLAIGKFPEMKTDKKSDESTKKKHHFPLSLCLEMRVIKKSDALLCPASIGDEEHVAYIEVLSTTGTPGYEQFFTDVAKEWVKLGGVPHWQKQWEFLNELQPDMEIFSYVREKYGKNIEEFLKVYDQLHLDPDGVFMNDTMKKLLLNQ